MDILKNVPDASAIGKAIAKIKRAGGLLDEMVHKTAIDCLLHSRAHGDPVLLTRLYYALPAQADRRKFVAWVKAHSPVGFRKVEHEGQKTDAFRIKKGWTEDEFLVGEAEETPFWAFETAKGEGKAFELEMLYKRMISLAVKAETELADDEEALEVAGRITGMIPNVLQGELKSARAKAAKKLVEVEAEAQAA